jgi:hypothetical protein
LVHECCSRRCLRVAECTARRNVSSVRGNTCGNWGAGGVHILTRATTWLLRTGRQTLAGCGVEGLPRLAVSDAVAAAERGTTRAAALAHPAHTLLSRCATVGAASAVALVGLQVYAPAAAAALAFRAAADLLVPPPYAVLGAALGVPTAPATETPAIVVRQATPGTEANALPTSTPPSNLSALPRERVPLERPRASSSKEFCVVSLATGCPLSRM